MRFVFDSIAVRKTAHGQQRRIEIRGHLDGEGQALDAMDAVWVRLSQEGSGVAVQASVTADQALWCAIFTSGIHFSDSAFSRQDLPVRIEVSSAFHDEIISPLIVNLPNLPNDHAENIDESMPSWLKDKGPSFDKSSVDLRETGTGMSRRSETSDIADPALGHVFDPAFAVAREPDPNVMLLREDQRAFDSAQVAPVRAHRALADERSEQNAPDSSADRMRQTLNALMRPTHAELEPRSLGQVTGKKAESAERSGQPNEATTSAALYSIDERRRQKELSADSGPAHDVPQSIGLRVRDHRGRIVNSLEAMRPGVYRLEAVFDGDDDQPFFWSINGVRQAGHNGRYYEVELSPGSRISIAVAARPHAQQAITATALDLRTDDDFDPPTVTAFGPDQFSVDLDVPQRPGVYRLRATGTGIADARKSWRVDGVEWGDGSEIAIPLAAVSQCGAAPQKSVVLRLTHQSGGQEFLSAALKLADSYVFCGLHWGIRLALVAMAILCLCGSIMLMPGVSPEGAQGWLSDGILVSLLAAGIPVTMLFTVLWRIIAVPDRRDWVNLAWQTMMGSGLMLLMVGSCAQRAHLFVPSGIVLLIGGLAVLGAAMSLNRRVPGQLPLEIGGLGMVFLAVSGPLIAFDPCIPSLVKLMALFIGCLLSTGLLASHIVGRSDADLSPQIP